MLDGAPSEIGFESQFAEIRGDIHLANGESVLALDSYQLSLDTLEDGVGNRSMLVMKIEALGADIAEQASAGDTTDGGEM